MQLQTIANEIAAKIHAENYSADIEEGLLAAVRGAADLFGCDVEDVWQAVRAELRAHFYH